MRISKISIRNYRAIHEFTCELDTQSDCLVLAGLNGSGKSSVLEAILVALGCPFEMREPLKDQPYEVSLTCVDGSLEVHLTAALNERRQRDITGFNALYFSSWRAPKRVHGITLRVGKKGRRPDKEERNALWNLKQWLVSLPSYASYPSGQEMADKIAKIGKEVDRMWHEFYPDRNDRFVADIETGGQEDVQKFGTDAEPKFELYLDHGDSTGRVSVDELSSGEIEILSLFGTLIADRFLTGAPADFVFLDEPELHLNPVWHRMLVPTLRKYSPGTQFFIATHSPAVWDSVYSDERIFLKNGHVVNEIPEGEVRHG